MTGLPVVQQGSVMNILAGLSNGSRQGGTEEQLALWGALEEELHDSSQEGQLDNILLLCKALHCRLQQVWRILHCGRVQSPM